MLQVSLTILDVMIVLLHTKIYNTLISNCLLVRNGLRDVGLLLENHHSQLEMYSIIDSISQMITLSTMTVKLVMYVYRFLCYWTVFQTLLTYN